ncbi:MAG TPA: SDR family NAD(P)-dependent oxidoreductase [Jiangellaceae bacterium]|nr:SDR family NAD(P)-dependent oxidoreductase [Jiangellaceae bacterium]
MTQRSHNQPVAVVTGATGMLGSATAAALASRGASTVLVVRDQDSGRRLIDSLPTHDEVRHRLVVGDLSEPGSVRDVAEQIRAGVEDVAVLIHAAAALFRERRVNSAGHEAMFATNVLARFLLTHELKAPLEAGPAGRVINVTGPTPDRLDFDDLMAEQAFNAFRQFRATNAANLQLAFELARRARETSVTSNAYTPGALQSDLMAEMPPLVRVITLPFGRSAAKAAEALSDLAVADHYATTTGEFYKRERPSRPPKASLDAASQRRLWGRCAQLLGVDPATGFGAGP